jgi:Flp pilus assembly protein TadD
VVGFRAEAHEVIAYCAARRAAFPEAIEAAREAIRRDPRNWRLSYVLALLLAAVGEDPSGPAATAWKLDPLEPMAQEAVRVLEEPGGNLRALELLEDAGR